MRVIDNMAVSTLLHDGGRESQACGQVNLAHAVVICDSPPLRIPNVVQRGAGNELYRTIYLCGNLHAMSSLYVLAINM